MDDKFPYLTKEEEDKVWKNAFIVIRRKEKQKRTRRIMTFGGMAAIVIFSSGLLGYNLLIEPDVYSADLDNLKVVLSDKSEVILQKGAKLTVEKSFQSRTRDVNLKGDAVFKISKSKEHPFIVHGNGYDTKVYGTIFKIVQSGKTFTVDLYEGKVSVIKRDNPSQSFVLRPDETFSNMGTTQVATVTRTSKTEKVYVQPSLTFNECPLGKVVEVIEKTYKIKLIVSDQEKNSNITISSKNSPAEALLEAIAVQLNLNLKKNNDYTFQLE
jgi:ferric-dicitrate binding protein FerR (iron transport regulator)